MKKTTKWENQEIQKWKKQKNQHVGKWENKKKSAQTSRTPFGKNKRHEQITKNEKQKFNTNKKWKTSTSAETIEKTEKHQRFKSQLLVYRPNF